MTLTGVQVELPLGFVAAQLLQVRQSWVFATYAVPGANRTPQHVVVPGEQVFTPVEKARRVRAHARTSLASRRVGIVDVASDNVEAREQGEDHDGDE